MKTILNVPSLVFLSDILIECIIWASPYRVATLRCSLTVGPGGLAPHALRYTLHIADAKAGNKNNQAAIGIHVLFQILKGVMV
jgi:hypothetical protein